MFWITKDPSSGSLIQYLAKITVMVLSCPLTWAQLALWQHILPVVCVCVHCTGRHSYIVNYTHAQWVRICCHNTNLVHVNGRNRTTPLSSKRYIFYIYSTNIGTEYFNTVYTLRFSLQNAVCFIILTYLIPVLFTFYIQCVLKFKKIIPAPKG